MKYTKLIFVVLAGLFLLSACQEEEYELGQLAAPENVELSFELVGKDAENPYGDGSGLVDFTATANNELTYVFIFGDGRDDGIAADGKIQHRFTNPGVNTYYATVKAIGAGGLISTKTVAVEVFSSFSDPEAIEFLTGGSAKTWYWAADQPGHIGLGPNFVDGTNHLFAAWYNAAPFEKTCMYDAEFVFTKEGDNLTFEQTSGPAYIPGTYAGKIGVEADACYGEDVVPTMFGVKNVSFAPSSSIATEEGQYRGTTINISDGGFLGWYVGKSEFEIISISENILEVRIQEDETFAWYQILTSVKPGSEETVDVEYSDLVWQDEFDTDGSPDAAKWGYDLGATGWGNNESQHYTDRTENVSVSDGTLKITAKKEDYEGSDYTSARIKTQDLYEFKYGRVDVRAKLPQGGGTWPAIWMLGANFPDVGWPACGEIDIMEATGNNPGVISSAIHTPSSSGATVNVEETSVNDPTNEFHIYSVNWSENQITFLVDDEIFYTYNPEDKNADTWPFDAPQFLILNVAMGGTLGGEIDPSFTEGTMEMDYVRVYQ